MIFPELIAYLLTLKYPGSEEERMNWVCYRGAGQLIIPLMPPGMTISYTPSLSMALMPGCIIQPGWEPMCSPTSSPAPLTSTVLRRIPAW